MRRTRGCGRCAFEATSDFCDTVGYAVALVTHKRASLSGRYETPGSHAHSNAAHSNATLSIASSRKLSRVRCPPLHAPLRRPCPRPPSREVRHSHPLACAQQAPRGSSDGLSAPRALMTSTNGNQTTSSGAGHERRRASHHLVRALRPAHGKRAVPVARVVLCTCSAIRSCA